MTDGKAMRKERLEMRDNLSENERNEKCMIIETNVLQIKEIADAENIFAYVSFRSEVSTFYIINNLLSNNKKVSVPITHVKERKMEAIEIRDIKKDLISGYCGILEPKKDIVAERVVDPEDIDVVIIPGSVFDERGGRFGYGGGYYDRFLEKIPSAVRVGLAFDLQVVKKAPIQEHDELLDYIVTESRLIQGKREK